MAWYEKSVEETLRELDTNAAAGISASEAAARRTRYGANEPAKKPERQVVSGSVGGMMTSAAILTESP